MLVSMLAYQCWADAPEAKPIIVPLEILKSKHVALQAKINGKGPYRLIFDTGAPFMVINNQTARESGIVGPKTKPPLFAPFGSLGPQKVQSLEIGDVKIENTVAAVMDHPTVDLMAKALGPIEGIVGYPFFARFATTIDYEKKELRLIPNGFNPPDTTKAMEEAILKLTKDRPRTVLSAGGAWGFAVAKAKDDEEAGVDVTTVLPGSAADEAGLKKGDRLLTIDGRWTDSVADTFQAAGTVKPGTAVAVVVRRDGKEHVLTMTPKDGL
jgi:membrane-associated protease RseP (regulator of RpoE activity)